MTKKIIIFIAIIAILAGGVYWFFVYKNHTIKNEPANTVSNTQGFVPIKRNSGTNTSTTNTGGGTTTPNTPSSQTSGSSALTKNKLPKLRHLSTFPVSGMNASTTRIKVSATSSVEQTILRYVDRGTGHIYQTNDFNLDAEKISNSTIPKIYEAYWNKNLNQMVLRYLNNESDVVVNFYAELRATATSTASSTTQLEIKGKYISPEIDQIAVSPGGDKVFTWNIENGNGVGYITTFDQKTKTKLIETPITQVNVDWPEESTVTITTKGSAVSAGYTYGINTKTGEKIKYLGGIRGLSTKLSRDAKNLIYSVGGNTLGTRIVNTKTSSTTEVIFNTLADKCVWSNLRKNEVYCAVPSDIPAGQYPDDWYKGKISFVDKIWHLDSTTGEVHLLANLLTETSELIDATQLTLDPKENFLYFINKDDLTLWSLDLNL